MGMSEFAGMCLYGNVGLRPVGVEGREREGGRKGERINRELKFFSD